MKKHETITRETRNNLNKAFWDLYKNNELSDITINKICKNANYNRTTFYRYFTDIDDILNQFENNIIENIKISIKNTDNKLRLSNDSFRRFSDKYGEFITIFYEKGERRFYLKFRELIKNDVYNYLNYNIKDEEAKNFLYEFLFSSVIVSYVSWYKNQKLMSFDSLAKLLQGMLINSSKLIINEIKKD